MASSALLVVAIIGLFYLQLATAAITHCYKCASPGQPECDDTFNTSLSIPVMCSFDNILPWLPGVRLEDTAKNNGNTKEEEFEYYCVKLEVEYKNGTDGIIRTCLPYPESDTKICDAAKDNLSPIIDATLTNCNACNDVNNCNSAGSICASILMIFIAMLLTKSY